MSVHHRHGWFRGQKRVSYPLELLQMAVSTMWIKGIEPRFSGRTVNVFNHQEDSSPQLAFSYVYLILYYMVSNNDPL